MKGTSSIVVALLAAGVVLTGACSSDESSTGSTQASSSSAASASSGGDPTPEESCVRPGDKGNAKGVGEYCTPGGSECSGFDEAPLCLATVGQDQWFCTRAGCNEKTDCGEGAGCLLEGAGSACVPCRCDDRGIGCPKEGAGGAGGGSGGGGAGGGDGAGGGGGAGGN